MKKVFGVLFILAFWGYATAQEIKVKEDKENIADAKNSVLTVIIYEADDSYVEKAWKNLMKEYNAKVSGKSEIFADDATITEMSTNTIDVYAYTKKDDEGVKLVVGFDLGGAFVSSSTHSYEFKAAEKIVKQFAVDASRKAVEEKLEDAMEKQKELEDELSGLKKKNDKSHKDIEEYKQKITDAEEDIIINEKDQETKTKEIEEQTKAVEKVQKKLDDIK
ncbi:MAG: hypothetical protein V1904_00440 [Bacteroidota bacterium]